MNYSQTTLAAQPFRPFEADHGAGANGRVASYLRARRTASRNRAAVRRLTGKANATAFAFGLFNARVR